MYKKTTGIILKRKKVGEADKLLVIYTNNFGKINAIGKGIERISSKRAGHLEPFILANLELSRGKNNTYMIREVQSINNFINLRGDLSKTAVACHVTELIDRSTPIADKNDLIFLLLKKTLTLLEKTNNKYIINIIRSFEMHLINLLGFRPELKKCLHCGKKDSKNYFFSFSDGGIFCQDCNHSNSNSSKLSLDMLQALAHLQSHKLIDSLSIDPEKINKIGNILNSYIKFILERDLESRKVINSLDLAQVKL